MVSRESARLVCRPGGGDVLHFLQCNLTPGRVL